MKNTITDQKMIEVFEDTKAKDLILTGIEYANCIAISIYIAIFRPFASLMCYFMLVLACQDNPISIDTGTLISCCLFILLFISFWMHYSFVAFDFWGHLEAFITKKVKEKMGQKIVSTKILDIIYKIRQFFGSLIFFIFIASYCLGCLWDTLNNTEKLLEFVGRFG